MSYITNVLISGIHLNVEELNSFFSDSQTPPFALVPQKYAAGTKVANDTLIGAFNYLNVDDFVTFFKQCNKGESWVLLLIMEDDLVRVVTSATDVTYQG